MRRVFIALSLALMLISPPVTILVHGIFGWGEHDDRAEGTDMEQLPPGIRPINTYSKFRFIHQNIT